jgi:autotransporter-associated beta strand protein
VVKVSNQNALGTTAGITVVNTTGTILIDSNNYTIDEPFTITGSGVTSGTAQGAIRNLGKITNLTGVITLGGAATIASSGYNVATNGVGLDSLIIKTGGINAGAYSLTTDVIRGMRIDGVISGTGGSLTKISGDTLVLGGTNTYTGLTLISAGAVEMKNSAAFGTASGTTTVASGATVQIEGADFTITEPITISGVGVSVNSLSQGAIKNIRNKNTWSGLITLGANATIVSGTLSGTEGVDSLVVSTGGINLSSFTLTTDVVKGMNISGLIYGTGGLTKTSADTLIIGKANTYTGATNINGGVLQLQNQDGLGSTTAGTLGASTTTVANGAALKITGTGYVIPEAISITGSGVYATGAIRNTVGSNTLSNTITVSADARINVDAGTLTLTNTTKSLQLTGSLNFGGASGNLTVSGPMNGAGSFIKDGGANTILTLSGNSTGYTGSISIGTATTTAAGVLKINTSVNALGTNAGSTTINNGSALQLEGGLSFAAEPTIIAGTGLTTEGVIRNVSGNNSYTGPITLTDASRINVDAGTLTLTSTATINTTSNAYSLTLGGATNMTASGIISGTGSLTKDGASTLFFDAENTYTGATYITSGIVQVQKSNALGSLNAGTGSSNTTVSDGAVIQIFGSSINIPEAITVFGTGVSNRGVIRNFTGSTGVNALTNTITLNSSARINVDAGTLSLTGTTNGISIAFGTYSLSAGVNTATSMAISGVLTGTGNLTKDSLGTLILNGSNTGYAGAITVYNGVMNIQNGNALGTTDVATTVLNNAALQMQGGITVAEADINIIGTGISSDGVLRNISGNNTFSGTLNLTGGSRIYIDAGTLSMTSAGTSISMGTYTLTVGGPSTGIISVGGVVTSAGSGAGALTKDGASTSYLYLTGNNTYTGNTVVSSGVLNIQHANTRNL